MVKRAKMLTQLEQIARLKAERELRTFGVISQHMSAASQRVEAMRQMLEQSYRHQAPLSLSDARIEIAQAGHAARDLWSAEQEADQLRPGFERLRQVAAREFGRAEALKELARKCTSGT